MLAVAPAVNEPVAEAVGSTVPDAEPLPDGVPAEVALTEVVAELVAVIVAVIVTDTEPDCVPLALAASPPLAVAELVAVIVAVMESVVSSYSSRLGCSGRGTLQARGGQRLEGGEVIAKRAVTGARPDRVPRAYAPVGPARHRAARAAQQREEQPRSQHSWAGAVEPAS